MGTRGRGCLTNRNKGAWSYEQMGTMGHFQPIRAMEHGPFNRGGN
jgi:hypothetical protein